MAVVGEIGTWGDVGVGGLAVVGVGGPVLLTAPGTDVIATVAPVFFFLRMTPVGRSGKRESMKFVLSCITVLGFGGVILICLCTSAGDAVVGDCVGGCSDPASSVDPPSNRDRFPGGCSSLGFSSDPCLFGWALDWSLEGFFIGLVIKSSSKPVDLNFVLGLFTVEARFLSGLASVFDLSLSAEGGLSILI